MIFSALKDAQLNTLKRPNSAGARLRSEMGGRGGFIRNVLGAWGPLGEEAHCYPYKLRTKAPTLAASGVTGVCRSLGGQFLSLTHTHVQCNYCENNRKKRAEKESQTVRCEVDLTLCNSGDSANWLKFTLHVFHRQFLTNYLVYTHQKINK